MLANLLAIALSLPGNFTTARLYEAAVTNLDCLDYCVVGLCFWLRCAPYCSVETTLRASHRSPDLVVSTYNNSGENPWIEANILSEAIGGSVASVFGLSGGHSDTDQAHSNQRGAETHSLQFSEADVFGGIGSTFIQWADGALPICEADTDFLRPYFISPVDWYPWREGITELRYPATFVPGLREVGTWGPVHPRIGFLIQADEPNACAVIAQRAADITTRRRQPHIYSYAGGPQTNERTDQWQMVHPDVGRTCGPFGRDPNASQGYGGERGRFAWQLWRRYSCCQDNPGAIFLFHISSEQACQ